MGTNLLEITVAVRKPLLIKNQKGGFGEVRTLRVMMWFLKRGIENALKKIPRRIRKRLCWLLGHRYPAIWLKPDDPILERLTPEVRVGVADTEAGCIYCGYNKPNEYPIVVSSIDWEQTKHRKKPPLHNVIISEV